MKVKITLNTSNTSPYCLISIILSFVPLTPKKTFEAAMKQPRNVLMQHSRRRDHLWNACDYVIQFTFVIARISGAQNTAADYLSCLKADPIDKLVMNTIWSE